MTDQHPITPPPWLVRQWTNQWHQVQVKHVELEDFVATQAARWGADQELKACFTELENIWPNEHVQTLEDVLCVIRAARRPKPPSLKEQALALIDKIQGSKEAWDISDLSVVRRALEALPE